MTDPIVSPNQDSDNLKRCPKCGISKPATLDYFSPRKISKSGLASWCRECCSTLNKLTRRAKAQVKAEKAREAARKRELEPPQDKHCITCGVAKPDTLEYFCKNRTAKSGIAAQCRECRAAEHRQRRYDRPSNAVEEKRKWEKENPGLKRCPQCGEGKPPTLEYFSPNNQVPSGLQSRCRTCVLENQRKWRKDNTDRYRAQSRVSHNRRRARRLKNSGTHSAADIRLQFVSQKGRCWWCGEKIKHGKYHVDHRIPLSRGGSNAPENLVIACPSCNLSKRDKLPHEWNGRLL